MPDAMYPQATRELAQKRRELAPAAQAAFDAFSRAVFENGALPAKMTSSLATRFRGSASAGKLIASASAASAFRSCRTR